MRRTAFNMFSSRTRLVTLLVIALVPAAPASAQEDARAPSGSRIVSSEISLSRDEAELRLELASGDRLTLTASPGSRTRVVRSTVTGEPGSLRQVIALSVPQGGSLDRSWRELLERAMDVPTDELPRLLEDWTAPDGGEDFDRALEQAMAGQSLSTGPDNAAPQLSDSLTRLETRVRELTERLESRHEVQAERIRDREHRPHLISPFRHIGRGVAGIMSVLITMAILFGLGFAIVFFGGRPHLEAVADTARHFTIRAFLVGLAASFLVVPAFILGIIVLTISIVGIPALLVWIPLFPVAVVLAAVLGYLAVAHAAGESLAERRFYGGEWFTRANSYYYLLTGLGLLLTLFVAANGVQMAGPWLSFIHGILMFFGVILTWAAVTTGFGAVLITRAGTRPVDSTHGTARYSEEPRV